MWRLEIFVAVEGYASAQGIQALVGVGLSGGCRVER